MEVILNFCTELNGHVVEPMS